MHLDGLDSKVFLQQFWQKQPLFITNGFPDIPGIISPDFLAEMACDPVVESRIVRHKNNTWQLENGPFTSIDFSDKDNWTLLVQAVNEFLPELTPLLDAFHFLPHWRLDDIMASHAVSNGGVGPHFDYYDVFLIQVSGERKWLVGQQCDETTPLQKNSELAIVADFETQVEYTSRPGDVLYIPSKIAHWGTALDDQCVTLSVGFRAPSHKEVISELPDFLSSSIEESGFYQDPDDLAERINHAEITTPDIEQLRKILSRIAASSDIDIAHWFGCYMTEPKYPEQQVLETPGMKFDELEENCILHRDETVRMAFYSTNNSTSFFCNGEALEYPASAKALVSLIANKRVFRISELAPLLVNESDNIFFNNLWQQGYWYVAS